jgi:hypothetical protein
MLSLEIARAHIRALEQDAERSRVHTPARPRRRMRDLMRRSH